MTQPKLNEEELLYLSARCGVDNLWGIADPFRNMEAEDISQKRAELAYELMKKGVLFPESDDILRCLVSESYQKVLSHCEESRNVYILSSNECEEDQRQYRFFENGLRVVKFCFADQASFSYIDRNLMRCEIENFFGNESSQESSDSFVADVNRIKRMGSLSRNRFLQELRNCKCPDKLAVQIVDSLRGNPEFRSLMVYERNSGREKLIGKLITLPKDGLMVTMPSEHPEQICFKQLNRKELQKEFDVLLGNWMEGVVV